MEFVDSWYEEKRSAYLYGVLAKHEPNPANQALFRDLAEMANRQAKIWETELQKLGAPIPAEFKPNLYTRFIAVLIKRLGAQRLRFILSALKVRGMSMYPLNPKYPFSKSQQHEHRHKGLTTAGNLRAAVFGVNDGLLSNVSLLLGIAGATSNQHFILLSGIAGLLAGACSMAAGEYISMRSQRDFFEYQIAIERSELELYPEEEAAELALIYHARGLSKADAEKLAQLLISQPEKALDTLAREELGLNPAELGSPWGAAISSFFSFTVGALIPLLPFTIGVSHWNLLISVSLAGVTLFCIGAFLSLFTNKSALLNGLRMLLIGAVAGAVTYFVGHLIGNGKY